MESRLRFQLSASIAQELYSMVTITVVAILYRDQVRFFCITYQPFPNTFETKKI